MPLYAIHDYWLWPNRYELLNSWWEHHKLPGFFLEALIPKLAIIVTADGVPVCFLAADMSNSIGKAYLETGLTAPGLSPAQARESLKVAEDALFVRLKELNYGFIQTFTASPAIARHLKRNGWNQNTEVLHLFKEIK